MNVCIPTSIYTAVEKYDQSEQAKMLRLQKTKKPKEKRNLLGTPDYLIDIPDPTYSFSNEYQKKAIKRIISYPASQRFEAHQSTLTAGQSDKVEESIWGKLSDAAKSYLTCMHIDPTKVNKFDVNLNALYNLSGIIYAYKKIWVAMHFPDAYNIDFNREVLINYSFMFKLGTKSSNLSCMQQIIDFAETIGYGSSNPVSFEQITASSGDVFIKAQLVLTKRYASELIKKAHDKCNKKVNLWSYESTKAKYLRYSNQDKYQSWADLHPFYENMSMKLKETITSHLYSYPDWYFYLSSEFKIDKTDFYPAAYQSYIGSDIQPDAKKFISFIEICLKNTLTQWATYQYRYSYTGGTQDTVKTVFQWHTDRIESFIKKIDTPRFRSMIHNALSLVHNLEQKDLLYLLVSANDVSCKRIEYLFQLIRGMYYIHSIWPDAPMDSFYTTFEDGKSYVLPLVSTFDVNYHLCDNYDEAKHFVNQLKSKYNLPFFLSQHETCAIRMNYDISTTEWLYDNIDPTMFIGWIKTSVNEMGADNEERYNSNNQENTIITSDTRAYLRYSQNYTLLDVMNMIKQNMNKESFKDFKVGRKSSLEKVEQALIDYAAENNITDGPIELLPTDLFPKPVEVVAEGFNYKQNTAVEKTWKFLQPKTTKHLRIWGDQVRNCVGSSTSYYTNMKRHKALIVLACIDNKPRITIYAELKDKQLVFTQVKDKMNESLSNEQQFLLKTALNKALQQMATT